MNAQTITIHTENFSETVGKGYALLDFWAPWCGPCRQLTPILEKAVRAAKGKVKLVKMNIDEHPQIPGQLGIQSIPAVIAFQRRFRPDLIDGIVDGECRAKLLALLLPRPQ